MQLLIFSGLAFQDEKQAAREPAAVFNHPLGEEMLPHVQSEPLTHVLSLDTREQSSAPPQEGAQSNAGNSFSKATVGG